MAEKTVQAPHITKVVVFSINNEQYGVPIESVISIEKITSITRVPHQYNFVKGVTNLRGLVVPIIDIKKRFKMGEVIESAETRLIIVKMDELTVGLMVDDAKQVIEIDMNNVDETPDIVGGPEADYIHGVAKVGDHDFLILLNLQSVLTDEEVQSLHQPEA
jgi:purine-binding chemotaxis protein CheW